LTNSGGGADIIVESAEKQIPMNAPRGLRRVLTGLILVAVLAWVAYGSFIAARELTDSGTSEADPAQPGDETQGSPVVEHQRIADEPTKPRFKGELLGMYLGPDLGEAPPGAVERNEQFRAETTQCLSKITHRPVESAQRFDLDFTPPPGFALQPIGVSSSGPVTSAVAVCSETGSELGVSWNYGAPSNGSAIVLRVHPTIVWQLDVAEERVSAIMAGGEEAILVAPINPENGYGSFAMVMFPRDDAFTYIHTSDVPLNDLLALADAVGQALPKAAN
jgi:hypothetical protein